MFFLPQSCGRTSPAFLSLNVHVKGENGWNQVSCDSLSCNVARFASEADLCLKCLQSFRGRASSGLFTSLCFSSLREDKPSSVAAAAWESLWQASKTWKRAKKEKCPSLIYINPLAATQYRTWQVRAKFICPTRSGNCQLHNCFAKMW